MRVLLDECLPRRLRAALTGHDVRTVPAFETSVIVLRARSNDIAALVPLMPAVVDELSQVGRGRVIRIGE